jgi:hypothetical protein
MAIIIPSKSIYQKENPKIRKNVIEKIEFTIDIAFVNDFDF